MGKCCTDCKGKETGAPEAEPAVPAERAGMVSLFRVRQMDCAAEEHLIRMALEPMPGVVALAFDLPNRMLQVLHNADIAPVAIKIAGLDLGAELLSTGAAPEHRSPAPDPQQQRRVLIWLLMINAVMFMVELVTGLLAQSTGLIADSLDMFADAAVYGMALFAVGRAATSQLGAARLAGAVQLLLALTVLAEVGRRFLYGSEPVSALMMGMGVLALVANVTCLYLIYGQREAGVHMRASWIFSANDVLANLGVISAGALVAITGSAWPDLLIGSVVGLLVLNGARRILLLKA